MAEETFAHEGSLLVEGGPLTKWKPLWFRLGFDGVLLGYKSQEAAKSKSKVKETISLLNATVSGIEYKKQQFTLQIMTSDGSQHFLVAQNRNTFDDWMCSIRNGIRYAKHASAVADDSSLARYPTAESLSQPLLSEYMFKYEVPHWKKFYFVMTRNFIYLFRTDKDTIAQVVYPLVRTSATVLSTEELSNLRVGAQTVMGEKVDVNSSFRFTCGDVSFIIAPNNQDQNLDWSTALNDPATFKPKLKRRLTMGFTQPGSAGGGLGAALQRDLQADLARRMTLGPRVMPGAAGGKPRFSSMSASSLEPPPIPSKREEETEVEELPPGVVKSVKVPTLQRVASRAYVDYTLKLSEMETRITMPDGQPGIQQSFVVDIQSGPSSWRGIHIPDDFDSLHAKLFDSFYSLRFPELPKFDTVRTDMDANKSKSKSLSHSKSQMLHQDVDKELSRIHGIVEEGETKSENGDASALEFLTCYLRELVGHPLVATSSSILAFLELNRAHRVVSIGDYAYCQAFRFSAEELQYVSKDGKTILHYAALGGVSEIISWLLDRARAVRLNVNAVDKTGNSALHLAASKGYGGVVQALLQNGADPTMKNRDGEIALHMACLSNSEEVAKLLSQNNSQSVNICDEFGRTPLHVAALSNAESLSLVLLRLADVDLSLSDQEGHTALHYASSNNLKQVVLSMVQKGADVNKADASGKTVLHHACSSKEGGELALMLLSVPGIDITLPDHNYMTPLHYCAKQGLTDISLRLAESNGAVLQKQDNAGRSPLHWMVVNDNLKVCERFLELGAGIDIQDNKGNTALMLAITERENSKGLDMVQLLGRFNANTELRDSKDYTVLMQAASLGMSEMCAELVKIGSDPEAVLSESGNTAMHIAASTGRTNVLSALVSVGADVGSLNEKGEAPLHVAIRSGKYGAAKTLVEIGADLDQKDNEGKSVGRDLAPPALLPQLKTAAKAYADAFGGEAPLAEQRKKMAKQRLQRKQNRKVGFGGKAPPSVNIVPEENKGVFEVHSPTSSTSSSGHRRDTLNVATTPKSARRLSSPIGFIRCEEEPEGDPLDPALEQLFMQLISKDSHITKFMKQFLTEEDQDQQNTSRLDCLYLLQEIEEVSDDDVNGVVEKVIRNHMLPASSSVVPLPKAVHNRVMASTKDPGEKRSQIAQCKEHLIRYLRNRIFPEFLKSVAYGECYQFIQEQEKVEVVEEKVEPVIDARSQWLEAAQAVLLVKFELPSTEPSMLGLTVGDTVLCLDRSNDSWWYGVNHKGQQGYFPPQYCDVIENPAEKDRVLRESGLLVGESTVNDEGKNEVEGLLDDLEQEREGEKEKEEEEKRKAEEERKRKEREEEERKRKAREEEEKRRKAEEEERKRKEEEKRIQQLASEEEKRKAREEEERRRKEEEEKRRKEEERKEKEEEERKRRAEEERKRKEEEEKQKRELEKPPPRKPLPSVASAPIKSPPSIPHAKPPPPLVHQKTLPEIPKQETSVQRLSRRFTQTDMKSAGMMPPPPKKLSGSAMPPPPISVANKMPSKVMPPPPPSKDKRSKSMGFLGIVPKKEEKKEEEKTVEVTAVQPQVSLQGIMGRSKSLKKVTIAAPTQAAPTPVIAGELDGILAHRKNLRRTIPKPVEQAKVETSASGHPPCPEPDCDCTEFAAHPFKKKQCRNCFHEHA